MGVKTVQIFLHLNYLEDFASKLNNLCATYFKIKGIWTLQLDTTDYFLDNFVYFSFFSFFK